MDKNYENARDELNKTLKVLDHIIEETYKTADRMGVPAWALKDSTGKLMLADLVIAKINALIALSNWEI